MSGKRSATSNRDGDISVLYDAWPLAYAPGSPAALHLLELIEALSEGIIACLALPGDAGPVTPGETDETPPAEAQRAITVLREPVPNTAAGRLRWEQQALPRIARQASAQILHTTSLLPPLFSPIPVVLSPVTNFSQNAAAAGGFAQRVRLSLGQGGFARVRAVLWPADLPAPSLPVAVYQLPPQTHSAFSQPQPRLAGLPESYLLSPDPPDDAALELLAAAWSWTSAGLGEDWALLVSGLEDPKLDRLRALCHEAGASGPVDQAALITPAERASAFQHAGAVLLTSPPLPWADAFLQSLACARPLAAEETPLAGARTGPAGYLVSPGDARILGAAVLTMLVEEDLAEQLTRAAQERVTTWQRETFPARLRAVYQSI